VHKSWSINGDPERDTRNLRH